MDFELELFDIAPCWFGFVEAILHVAEAGLKTLVLVCTDAVEDGEETFEVAGQNPPGIDLTTGLRVRRGGQSHGRDCGRREKLAAG